MPFVRGFLRILKRKDRWGRPVDPDYGIDEGEIGGGGDEHPDHGGPPLRPGHGLPPSWGGFPERPSHPIAPPWERPHWPPGPTDPDWGIDAGGEIDNTLPGEIDPEDPPTGIPLPPIALPPGSIWPPLPPSAPPGTHMFLMFISGVGYRYGVFTVPEKPEKPVRPERPAGGPIGRPPERPTPPGQPEVDPTRRR
jgi:hypothetical protein